MYLYRIRQRHHVKEPISLCLQKRNPLPSGSNLWERCGHPKRRNGLGAMDDDDLDCGVEDATEADGVLEEAVDVEDGGVGAGVGDVVDVRDHIVAHPRCGASPPEIATTPFAGADNGPV